MISVSVADFFASSAGITWDFSRLDAATQSEHVKCLALKFANGFDAPQRLHSLAPSSDDLTEAASTLERRVLPPSGISVWANPLLGIL